ncbi:uncharacterized protein [Eurosta solidaginis]|uniref:uncharacterized protein n=1 Tax=Eurosta solidaginis TaxID=178769 RepID=UPI00353146C7
MSQPQPHQPNEENVATSKSKKRRHRGKRMKKGDNHQNQQFKHEDNSLAAEGAGDGGTHKNKHQQPIQHTNFETKISKQPLQSKSDALNHNNNIAVDANLLNIYVDHLQRRMHSILLCSKDLELQRHKSDSSPPSPTTEYELNVKNNRPLSKSARLRRKRKETLRNKYVAIDCEMVGVGHKGQDDMLARVSIVNKQGEVLLDKFVKPFKKVIDYRTSISGIRPKDIENGEEFHVVQDQVIEILQGKILVGHAVRNDLAVLHIKHPYKNIRDTARYKPLCRLVSNGRTPSLKLLSQAILGIEIQVGEHNSIEDARAAMKIYNRLSSDWEKHLQNHERLHK